MGEHVVLDADSFLMKGEILESHTGWRGNPAKLARIHAADGAAAAAVPQAAADAHMAIAAE
jgi:hypothetical protein